MAIATERIAASDRLGSLIEENVEKLLTCVHCGLCLPACPTYRVLGNENDSPRGRIYLMRGLAEGKLVMGDTFSSHIDLCLGCRACEAVCPSGVPYGQLLDTARVEVAKARAERPSVISMVVRFALNQLFTRPRLLSTGMRLARWFRDAGPARLLFEARALGGRSHFALALLLASRSPLTATRSPLNGPSAGLRQIRNAGSRVAVLNGCVMEGLFSEVNRATERVLVQNGFELIDAKGQVCCGALHVHSGEVGAARRLARKNIEAFLKSGCERIVVNAAGCGSAMKEYDTLLADDPEFSERAREFSSKVRDISELLIESGTPRTRGSLQRLIAYDAPCHLMYAQKVIEAPLAVLKLIPGVTLIPLKGSDTCCGGAGIYNLQHPEVSSDILLDKIASIGDSGADTVATGNPGCIMQIGAGVLMAGLKVDVLHPIQLLDAADSEEQR